MAFTSLNGVLSEAEKQRAKWTGGDVHIRFADHVAFEQQIGKHRALLVQLLKIRKSRGFSSDLGKLKLPGRGNFSHLRAEIGCSAIPLVRWG